MTFNDAGEQFSQGGGGTTSGNQAMAFLPSQAVLCEAELIGVQAIAAATFTFTAGAFESTNDFHGIQVVNQGGTIEPIGSGPSTGKWLIWRNVDWSAYNIDALTIPSTATIGLAAINPISLLWKGYLRNTTANQQTVYYTWGPNTALGFQPVKRISGSARIRYANWP